MRHVLFVDDDPHILDGLRRLLHGKHVQWKTSYVSSGQLALDLLEKEPFDALVTDMCMPGMDGAELLAEVTNRYPAMIRIVLSGHARIEAVMQSIGSAHQYLAKPCNPEVLKQTLDRALAIRDVLGESTLQQTLRGLTNLPVLPAIYQELIDCLKSPDSSIADAGRIIGKDLGMTTSILKVVNSAYFGLPRPLATIERSVTFLGMQTVMSLVLNHALFSTIAGKSMADLEGLRINSLETATAARMLAKQEGCPEMMVDEAFLAGMLHHVGKLALAAAFGERYREVTRTIQSSGRSCQEVEKAVLSVSHAEAGAYLLGLWGFQDSLIEAVLHHANPVSGSSDGLSLAGMVHIAYNLVKHPEARDADEARPDLRTDYLDHIGLRHRWPVWQDIRRSAFEGKLTA